MKQLQFEQRQKKSHASHATQPSTTGEPSNPESKDQTHPTSSSSISSRSVRTDRPSRSVTSATNTRGGAMSSRDASTAVNTASSLTPSGLRSTSSLNRPQSSRISGSASASALATPPPVAATPSFLSSSSISAASPSTRALPPASTYSHLSPRHHQTPSTAWSPHTDRGTLQHAIGVNQLINNNTTTSHTNSRPARLDDTHTSNTSNIDDLQTTAPFPVATVQSHTAAAASSSSTSTPSSSQPSTPKHDRPASNLVDAFQPIHIAVPSIPNDVSSGVALIDDGGMFASKLSALASSISNTAQGLGLKYSMDAKLKLLVHEVDSAHTSALRQASQFVHQLRQDWLAAQTKLEDARQRYEHELLRARTTLVEKQRKLDKMHQQSLARATKEAESVLRGEYLEKSKRFEGIEKYNEAKLKQLEEQVRHQVKAQLLQDSKRSKQVEDNLQAQLTKLEESGQRLLQEKDQELQAARQRVTDLESRLKEVQQREKTWERKYERTHAERQKSLDEINSMRVELSQSRQDNTALLTKVDRLQNDAAAADKSAADQSSQLSNRILDLIAESDHLKMEQQAFKEMIQQVKDDNAQQIDRMKQKHAQELDTIQSKISVVLQKKDEQIGHLKQKLQEQTQRVRDIERELSGI